MKPWDGLEHPDFLHRRIFVLPGAGYGETKEMFAKCNAKEADELSNADLVVFLGGEDINPSLYNQVPLPGIRFNHARDFREREVYEECLKRNIPMFGICRGMQFLSAVSGGGDMWQDVNHHGGQGHEIIDVVNNVTVYANSYHHQMVRVKPKSGLELIAMTVEARANHFKDHKQTVSINHTAPNCISNDVECEAVVHPDQMFFGVQGHPEWGALPFQTWTLHRLLGFMCEWETRIEEKYTKIMQQAIEQKVT